MCNQVCHTVRENALTMNCSLIFKSKRQYIVHLFFYFFTLAIKDKTKISLTIKILHLGQGSFTRKIIVSIFVKLFLILGRIWWIQTGFSFETVCQTIHLLHKTGSKPESFFSFVFNKLKLVSETDQTASWCSFSGLFSRQDGGRERIRPGIR